MLREGERESSVCEKCERNKELGKISNKEENREREVKMCERQREKEIAIVGQESEEELDREKGKWEGSDRESGRLGV